MSRRPKAAAENFSFFAKGLRFKQRNQIDAQADSGGVIP
jgi:hypothetical protein